MVVPAMETESHRRIRAIPEQAPISWRIAYVVSWAGLKRRLLRAVITMSGVILAIAFLTYMLVTDSMTKGLVAVGDPELDVLLQKAGVDIFSAGETDQMMILLIGLSLFTCLVGIINSMLMSVAERVREIGTLKCLGARDAFIVKSYLIESSLQGIIGSCAGALLGLIVALAIAGVNYHSFAFTNLPVLGSVKAILSGFLIGSGISVVASIGPAYMAARKQPVEALRVEE